MNTTLQGRISYWNDERAFGFVRQDKGGADLFVHLNNFADRIDPRAMEIGQRVTYEECFNQQKGKPYAGHVRLLP